MSALPLEGIPQDWILAGKAHDALAGISEWTTIIPPQVTAQAIRQSDELRTDGPKGSAAYINPYHIVHTLHGYSRADFRIPADVRDVFYDIARQAHLLGLPALARAVRDLPAAWQMRMGYALPNGGTQEIVWSEYGYRGLEPPAAHWGHLVGLAPHFWKVPTAMNGFPLVLCEGELAAAAIANIPSFPCSVASLPGRSSFSMTSEGTMTDDMRPGLPGLWRGANYDAFAGAGVIIWPEVTILEEARDAARRQNNQQVQEE